MGFFFCEDSNNHTRIRSHHCIGQLASFAFYWCSKKRGRMDGPMRWTRSLTLMRGRNSGVDAPVAIWRKRYRLADRRTDPPTDWWTHGHPKTRANISRVRSKKFWYSEPTAVRSQSTLSTSFMWTKLQMKFEHWMARPKRRNAVHEVWCGLLLWIGDALDSCLPLRSTRGSL